jgi:hypothetical protein
MMHKYDSEEARDRHVVEYVGLLRKSLTADRPAFDEEVIKVLANMYRQGWDDADAMFREWEMDQ